jgi:oligopeptide/dipeptide ABC transporter ATP-binding protein
MTAPALQVDRLSVEITRAHDRFRAVDDVSFSVAPARSIGLVGESGCGKSITLRAIMGLLPDAARAASGSVAVHGTELPLEGKKAARARRGHLAMIFQDPGSALNPVQKVGDQIAETPRIVLGESRSRSRARALELLRHVGIADPERRYDSYPYELSGGTRQRVMIAIALASQPNVLLCDEPTTALDVTIQAQILRLLVDLRKEMGLSVVFVTHELALVGQLCEDVCVMYASRLVETGPTPAVLERPLHPYTLGLLYSAVDLDEELTAPKPIPGSLPDPARRPAGCPFHPRCFLAGPECATTEVALADIGDGRCSACLRVDRLIAGDGLALLKQAASASPGPEAPPEPAQDGDGV